MIEAWTDYPFLPEDPAGQLAPLRPVTIIGYDGDKYVTVLYDSSEYEFKAGYVYTAPGRIGEVPSIGHAALCRAFPAPPHRDVEE